ncbi:O-antigen ligase family protein [Paludicola sp. MB14-C6]|uniref:O-antigen ligase family protein n=1 Tax=Paludihabitans sp. MB14-C6 TaxID=3070656 RepID=UPI0027DDF3A9|nr:O-antigen ligase family protein [Paludicola sp. MB14-C6]WMJ23693.1 O-antigen ligase family protein [Paludicola sp. MB14-C6]
MSDIQEALTKLMGEKVKSFSKPQLLLAITVASIFTHFIITCAVLLGVTIYALANSNIRKMMFHAKGLIWLGLFSILIIVVPSLYGRWVSALIGIAVIIVILFYLFAQSIITDELYHYTIDIACFMSLICFIVALGQKLFYGFSFRSTAGLLNANYYGTIIEFVVLLCVYRIIIGTKMPNAYIGVILINILGLFLCDCQSSWLSIIAGVFILICFNKYKKYALLFLAIASIFVCIGIFVPGILPRWDRMPQTFSTRMNIWRTAIQGIKAHPLFGQGTLTYMFINKLYKGYDTYHAHSLYLDPLLSYGIVGVGLLITYLCNYFKALSYQVNKIRSLVFAFVAAVCVHGITDISILWVQTGLLLLFIASGCFIEKKNNKDEIIVDMKPN